MDWLEQELVTEIDNQSTLECLEKLALYTGKVRQEFPNLDDWKQISPKIRHLLKSYGGCIRNRLQDPSAIEDYLVTPLNDTLWNLHDLAKDFWKKEVNIGVVCWTVLMEIVKTVPLNSLQDSFLERLCVTVLQLVREVFENWTTMSEYSSFSKVALFISKLFNELLELSLDIFLQNSILPYLLDTWCRATVHLDYNKLKESHLESFIKVSEDLTQLVTVTFFETPNLVCKVWLDSVDTMYSERDCCNVIYSIVLVANILKCQVAYCPDTERKFEISLCVLFHFCLLLIGRHSAKCRMLMNNNIERNNLITSLVLILEDTLNYSSTPTVVEYLFFHITGDDSFVRLLCMSLFKHVIRRKKISITKFYDLQQKLNEMIGFGELFDCKAIVFQLILLKRECFESEVSAESPVLEDSHQDEPTTDSQMTSCTNWLTTELNSPNKLDSYEADKLLKVLTDDSCSLYDAYYLLSYLNSRKLSLAETSAVLKPIMECGSKWNSLVVIVCEVLSSAIQNYPEVTTYDKHFISFITCIFRKLTSETNYCSSNKQHLVLFDAHCLLVLMHLAATFCRFAPDTCVQQLGKDPLLAGCLRSVLLKKSLVDVPTLEELKESILTKSGGLSGTRQVVTEMDIVDHPSRRHFTRLLLGSILVWSESKREQSLEQAWVQIRQSLDALLLKQPRKKET
ncbi:hypothetical protein GpartN1_g29.t1 [Galdieria partita]|uniref:Uncharacterized protein n=1 Tax=Galdieria partita TaxID=83374 RepID=A0A9C7PPF3_9RHOD|nr:hypothetical protein GpartN1_g29.t1 [Galdieria partita]